MFSNINIHHSLEECIDIIKDNTIILVAEGIEFDYELIAKSNKSIYGAIFPEVIYKDKHYIDAIVSFEVENLKTISIEPLVEQNSTAYKDAMTIFTIVDGLSANISIFLEDLFNTISDDTVIIGGGAGKLTLKQEPILFDNSNIYKDAALVIASDAHINLGVNHGWQILSESLTATDSDKNILKQINFRDALDVYKEIVEEDAGVKLKDDNFFDIAKCYPLGISKIDNEILVRDPIATDGKSLILVGQMDKNSVINILKGDKNNLIKSAGLATKEAESSSNTALVVDCISRVLFLGDDFAQELKEISDNSQGSLIFGVLSLGEIANKNQDYIEFYNKTCVVGR
jgi:hypothetical protein